MGCSHTALCCQSGHALTIELTDPWSYFITVLYNQNELKFSPALLLLHFTTSEQINVTNWVGSVFFRLSKKVTVL